MSYRFRGRQRPFASASVAALPSIARHSLLCPCAVALACLAAFPVSAQPVQSDRSATSEGPRRYDIPAGNLAEAVNRLAASAGVFLAAPGGLVQGRSSPGLRGSFRLDEAFAALLAGSGLEAVQTAQGQYALRQRAGAPADTPTRPDPNPATLPLVTVSAFNAEEKARALHPLTTIGSKIPLAQREIPNTVEVVTQERIQQQNLQSLDEALRSTPGVFVYQSDADRVQYYSRGYPISSMQIDGVPVVMNPDMSSTGSTNAANLTMYERIEVLDGPSGLYNGLGTVGGTINLVRKRAPEQFQGSVDIGVGTDRNDLGRVDVGGPLNDAGTLRGRLAASAQTQDLPKDGRWRKNQALYGTLEADLAPGTLLRIGASKTWTDSNVGWANANGLFAGTGRAVVAGTPSGYYGADWNRDRYNTNNAFASLEQQLAGGWKLHASLDYTYNTARVFSGEFFSNVDPATQQANIGTTNTDYWERNTAFDLNASGKFGMLGREHSLTVGANYTHMYNYGTSYYGPNGDFWNITGVDYFNIHFPTPTWSGLPAETSKGAARTNQFGVYANTRLRLSDAITAVVGARVSHWSNAFEPDATYNPFGYTPSKDTYSAKVTPFGGLIYDIDTQYTAYASYSTVFQPQTVHDRSGTLIKPIEGNQYEVGLKGTHLDGRLQTAAALFQITQKNRALQDPTDPTASYYVAQGQARTRGVDLRVSGELSPGWTVNAGYTYTHTRLQDANSIDAYTSAFSQVAPRHLFKVWTNYRLPGALNQWEVGAGVNATSQLFYDGGTYTVVQGGFYTADMRVAYHVTPKVSLNLHITNLFDRSYYQPMWNSVVYGAGRQAMVTLQAKF